MACDFLTVDTVFSRRLHVLVFIELGTRIVHVAGITARPTGEWVTQQARNVIDVLTERASPMRFLIRDRDTKFTAGFDKVFRSDGTRIIRTPVRASGCSASTCRTTTSISRTAPQPAGADLLRPVQLYAIVDPSRVRCHDRIGGLTSTR